MASGIEIAGLLLAVLPIFISAAEHYKDGIGFVKRAVKKEMFAEQYRDELIQQRTLLSLYIKGIVGKTSLSPKTQLILVDDLTGEAWRRSDVVKQLKTELGDAYQPFLDTVSRVCKALARQIKDISGGTLEEDEVVRTQYLSLRAMLTIWYRFSTFKPSAWKRHSSRQRKRRQSCSIASNSVGKDLNEPRYWLNFKPVTLSLIS